MGRPAYAYSDSIRFDVNVRPERDLQEEFFAACSLYERAGAYEKDLHLVNGPLSAADLHYKNSSQYALTEVCKNCTILYLKHICKCLFWRSEYPDLTSEYCYWLKLLRIKARRSRLSGCSR